MNEILIVPFSPQYESQAAQLIVNIQQQEFAIPITLADQPDLREIPHFYQQGTGNFWLALAGDRVVGTIALLDIGDNRGALRKMFVHRDFRGKLLTANAPGVAQQLLDTLCSWAKSRDVRELLLGTTDKFLAAHRFYEKNGFEQVNKLALPDSFPVMVVDSRFYKKGLS